MWFTIIKNYYLQGIYDNNHLESFVLAKMITRDQMEEIKNQKNRQGVM